MMLPDEKVLASRPTKWLTDTKENVEKNLHWLKTLKDSTDNRGRIQANLSMLTAIERELERREGTRRDTT
jgi:hypothetical protein